MTENIHDVIRSVRKETGRDTTQWFDPSGLWRPRLLLRTDYIKAIAEGERPFLRIMVPAALVRIADDTVALTEEQLREEFR